MHPLNLLKDMKPYHVEEIPINSHESVELLNSVNITNINSSVDICKSWKLQKVYSMQNKIFERDFIDKREEIRDECYYPDNWDIRYGFLATMKESMIHRIAEEGLEVRMCPYNFMGHSISGVHVSMNADVCLNEAKTKISPGNEITLIIFKYILGKRKMVAMYDPKVLLAPTPNFDSHACEERPIPNESIMAQYTKSLVYLYEFANENLEPVLRPRHCCPIGALIFKSPGNYEVLDLTEPDGNDVSSYNNNYLNSVGQNSKSSLWNASYPFNNDDQDSQNQVSSNDWRPINYGDQYNRSAGDSMLLRPVEPDSGPNRSNSWKDKRSDRNQNWKDGVSVYGGKKYNNLMNNRIGKPF